MGSLAVRIRVWKLVLLGVIASFVGLSGAALAAGGSLHVSPSTGLANGQTVTVSGSGFAASSTGTIVECNNDPNQPNVTVAGNAVPVACTNPLTNLVNTDASGNLSAHSFAVHTGTVGPAATGTDSSGGDAATDAAKYPCPPTAAQIAAGDSCIITFGDANGDDISVNISFAAQATPAGGTTPAGGSSPAKPSSTPSTSPSSSAAPSTLTNTGPGNILVVGASVAVAAAALRYFALRRKIAG